MPTPMHPQAKFDPIPPDLNLHDIVERTPNFKWVQRVSRAQIRNLGQQEFEKLVLIHVVAGGKPLVIDGWDAVLPKGLFDASWLENTYDKKQESVRDIAASNDIPMTMGHYLRSMRQLANQWTPNNFRDDRRQRLYLKDIDCPPEWHSALQKVIHPNLFYLNENASEHGGAKSQEDDIFREEATSAPAGDLMSSLPEDMRAQNLMCYIGHEGTYTPAHREMCASLGQNIMVEASSDADGEKAGSSIWFMTESKDREVVREYFLSMLGHDIEIEKHFAQINAWKKAPFDVYVVEQKAGDFILIPPLAAHQVWNRGTRTMKVAWNRTTAETLELALHEALPKARLVCRDEQYKNKAIVYFTLEKYYRQLQEMEADAEMAQMSFLGLGQEILRNSPRAKQLAGDFKKLFGLFTEILLDEMVFSKEKDMELIPFDSCITCSYCRSNIFNRFLTCKHCVRTLVDGDEDAYDVCMECYAMGRSCACMSGLQWCEQWSWSELVNNYEAWRSMIIKNDGYVDLDSSPQPLEVARLRAGKKTVAQICQEALRRRPWKDITKQDRENAPTESEPEGEDKPKKRKRKKKKGELRRCHVCCHKDYSYRVHSCTNPGCAESYCYGVLYRAFDMEPQKVLENMEWQCPKCLGICNCGHCRRNGNTNPYTPKNTLLGHDTRPIADDRSVEALVDFRIHNLSWLKAAGEESRSKDSKRMKRLRDLADNAKAQGVTEEAEAEHTMQNELEVQDGSANPSHSPRMDGYGDQSHVVGQGDTSMADDTVERPYQPFPEMAPSTDGNTGTIEPMQDSDPLRSMYPDPSMASLQRIGMGYYEQDDTPDKILFDPFQAPSEEAMRIPKSDVPEFVKKSIRAAKRKAKRENEDPDFVVGKSHHKRPRLTVEPDFLDSMDPALFGGTPIAPEASMHDLVPDNGHPANEEVIDSNAVENPPEKPSEKKAGVQMFDANEPQLRHAKPRASYVELNDVDIDESEEEDLPRRARSPPAKSTESRSAVDLAADAVRALFGGAPSAGDEAESSTKAAPSTEPKVPKKRGRPPKNASARATPTKPVPEVAATPNGTGKRPRGRPRKSNLSQITVANDTSHANESGKDNGDEDNEVEGETPNSDDEHNKAVEELEAQLSRDLAADIAGSGVDEGHPRRRGRPRKAGITTIAASSAAANKLSEASSTSESKPKDIRTVRRTRRSEGAAPVATVAKSLSSGNTQLLSMAERMALRGKKFKIGKRKPHRSSDAIRVAPSESPAAAAREKPAQGRQDRLTSRTSSSSPGYQSQSEQATPSNSSIPGDNSRSPTPPRPRRHIGQLTVVRLAESDSEAESNSVSNSDSGSGSGEDIPAQGRNTKKALLRDFQGSDQPPYAILSHRWGEDEVTLRDVQALRGNWDTLDSHQDNTAVTCKAGFRKLASSVQLARRNGFEYIWVDTCCIDKTSSAELSEAINSMYQWYETADACYAYLNDVKPAFAEDMYMDSSSFRQSRWFRRGWTLQELIAPGEVDFFASDWSYLGNKRGMNRFTDLLYEITRVPNAVLLGDRSPSEASVASRMSWAAARETTRVEDIAYCLLGLFDVNMPLLYGEGEKAFTRLQEQILSQSDDETIFAWNTEKPLEGTFFGLLAERPSYFRNSDHLEPVSRLALGEPWAMTSKGLKVEFNLQECTDTPDADCFVVLNCESRGFSKTSPIIYLKRIWVDEFTRVIPHKIAHRSLLFVEGSAEIAFVKHKPSQRSQFIRIIAENTNFADVKWDILDVHPKSRWSDSVVQLRPSDFRIGQALALLRIKVDGCGTIDVAVGLKLHNQREFRSWCVPLRSDSAKWNVVDNFWVVNHLLKMKPDLGSLKSNSTEDINGRGMPVSVTVVERHGVRNLELILSIKRCFNRSNQPLPSEVMEDCLSMQHESTLEVVQPLTTSYIGPEPQLPLPKLSFSYQSVDLNPLQDMEHLANIYLPQPTPDKTWFRGEEKENRLYGCLKDKRVLSPPQDEFQGLCYEGRLDIDTLRSEDRVMDCKTRDSWIGFTPFVWALAGGQVSLAMALLELDTHQLYQPSEGGFSALHVAAGTGQRFAIDKLVKYILDDETQLAKHMARDIREFLLTAPSGSTRDTPLHLAAAFATKISYWDMDPLSWNSFVSASRVPQNKWGATPLHLAALTGNLAATLALLIRPVSRQGDIVRFQTKEQRRERDIMATHRAHSVDNKGRSCAWYAAYSDSPEIIKSLWSTRAPFDLADHNGFTPIHVACCLGNVSSLVALMEHGANINVPTSDLLLLPTHIAAIYGQLECLKVLIESKAITDHGGYVVSLPFTAIALAIANGHLECADVLWSASPEPFVGVVPCVVSRSSGAYIAYFEMKIDGDHFEWKDLTPSEPETSPTLASDEQETVSLHPTSVNKETAWRQKIGSWRPWSSSRQT
ncbi:hypothetical protein AK830_g5364 [Neonectria ditissima]|uniref:JmjC domain-containing protein n=1 Tax=Neonectria ditissima TaxID=78410 RepID=A0A0P7BEG8_9HYPO|nr:hypothetical protein AK830_g5364 [Neonectria ditissima]